MTDDDPIKCPQCDELVHSYDFDIDTELCWICAYVWEYPDND